MVQATESHKAERHAFVKKVHGIRYQVKDVARSVAFYTHHLGFTLEHQQLPAFASVSVGDARILLSGPGCGFATDAEWTTAGTWRLESRGVERRRFATLHRGIEEGRTSFSQRHGERAGRASDPNRRS